MFDDSDISTRYDIFDMEGNKVLSNQTLDQANGFLNVNETDWAVEEYGRADNGTHVAVVHGADFPGLYDPDADDDED